MSEANQITSIRSFAKYIKVDSSSLIRLFNGKRELPLNSAHKVVDALNLKGEERDNFIRSVLSSQKKEPRSKNTSSVKYVGNLKCEAHKPIITNHEALSILALFYTDLPKTLSTVMSKLSLDVEEAEQLLRRLYFARLIDFKDGSFYPTETWYSTTDGKHSETIRESHSNLLKIAQEKLKTTPVTQLDYTSMKIPCTHKSIDKVKKEIRSFQNKIFKILSEEQNKTDVFELAIQFFPQSKIG